MGIVNFKDTGSVLIVNYGNVGDLAISLVVPQNMYQFLPEKKIFLIVSEKNKELLVSDPSICKYFVWQERNGLSHEDINVIKNANIDVIIFFRGVRKGMYTQIFHCLKQILPHAQFIGMIKDESERYGFNHYWTHQDKETIYLRVVKFVKFLLGQNTIIKPKLHIPQDILQNVFNKINEKIGFEFPLIYINLSAGSRRNLFDYIKRNISVKKYMRIIKELTKKHKFNIAITTSDEDIKKGYKVEKYFADKNNVIFLKTENILELASVIKLSKMIISPETSVVHIASLFNKPIVGLYSSKKRIVSWAPFSDSYICVLPKIERYMNTIDVGYLLSVLDTKIDEWL